jgi:hypothetical protein
MTSCIINHKTFFPFHGFLILKKSTEGVSAVQTQIYKVLQSIHTLLGNYTELEVQLKLNF